MFAEAGDDDEEQSGWLAGWAAGKEERMGKSILQKLCKIVCPK